MKYKLFETKAFQLPVSAWLPENPCFINTPSTLRMMDGLKALNMYLGTCYKELESKSKSVIPQADLNDNYV